MSADPHSLASMARSSRGHFAYLDRYSFADASVGKRSHLTRTWLAHGRPAPADTEFVRRVRERDLGDARAMFGPFVTLASILGALTIAAANWQLVGGSTTNLWMLLVTLLAPIGMLVGLAGAGLALHRVASINRELADIDARAG